MKVPLSMKLLLFGIVLILLAIFCTTYEGYFSYVSLPFVIAGSIVSIMGLCPDKEDDKKPKVENTKEESKKEEKE